MIGERSTGGSGGDRLSDWTFQGPDYVDPASFIRSFCADYKSWNDTAMIVVECSSESERPAAWDEASEAYAHFLSPFIAEDTGLQLIAFSSESSFDPSRLRIGTVEKLSGGCRAGFSIRHSVLDHHDDYVAEIDESGGRAFSLRQVWYVDPYPENGKIHLPFL